MSSRRPNFRRRDSWRLIVRRSIRFCQPLFSILSPSYPETALESSQKRKVFRLCRFIGQAESSLPGSYDSDCPRHGPRNLSCTRSAESPIPATDRVRSSTANESDAIAGMFMPIFEGELGDPRFIELAQAFRYHAIVLFLGRARER